MTTKEAHDQLMNALQVLMAAREASNVTLIVFEDVFEWKRDHPIRLMSEAEQEKFDEVKSRLLIGEPLQYILGLADFYGLKFRVSPAVLIPRPETEELVYQILEQGKQYPWETGLDIGTGSGCIPISLKKNHPNWRLSGMDISAEALEVAKENALINGVEVLWERQSILDREAWSSLPTYDFIVSNPPYIPDREREIMSSSVLDFEPSLALFVPDDDPFLFYRTIVDLAARKLNPGGALFFEVNEFNAEELLVFVPEGVFETVELIQDMQGKHRIFYAQRSPV